MLIDLNEQLPREKNFGCPFIKIRIVDDRELREVDLRVILYTAPIL